MCFDRFFRLPKWPMGLRCKFCTSDYNYIFLYYYAQVALLYFQDFVILIFCLFVCLFICLFVCLFVWSFSSLSRTFHSFMYGDVTIADEGLQILTYARHSWPLSSEGSLACHTYCDMGPFIMVISEDP